MVIDCRTCAMRDLACSDCVVSNILALPELSAPSRVDLPEAEHQALRVLQGAGLLPPLRLVTGEGQAMTG